jgi:hypothetical protein
MEEKEPDYKLIQAKLLETDCAHHTKQFLVDLYNSPEWGMKVVDVDKILFRCRICGSERVYQLID